jgi:integral membrane protein
MSPRSLFQAFAVAEAVTWTLLIVGMVLKYGVGAGDLGVRVGGGIHGFVFLAYLVVTTVVAVNQRWPFGRLVLGWASAVVPYATIPFEVVVARRGGLDGTWRHADDSERRGPLDGLLFAVLRRPWLASGSGVVLVALVFGVLLTVGPPVPTR